MEEKREQFHLMCSNRLLVLRSIYCIVIFCSSPFITYGQQGLQQPARNYQSAVTNIPIEHLPAAQVQTISNENPEKLALKRPLETPKVAGTSPSGNKPANSTSVLPAMACCLAILMVFWLVTLSFKKKSPQFAPAIPTEALEFLGRKSIDLRSSIYYLRCGSRILIVGHSEAGLQTLGEVTDPLEVDIISGMCRAEKSRESSISESFKTLFLRTESQDSGPMPTSSLKDRLHKPATQAGSAPVMRDGRKIG